jgi:hypothetical protein
MGVIPMAALPRRQLDRSACRAYIGFPLGEGGTLPGVTPMSFFITLGQAFTTPVVGRRTGTTVSSHFSKTS